jgi:ribonuclease inhibitor
MKNIILDGNKMTSIKQTHKYIKEQFNFPSYYGENLDALWDLLSTISSQTDIELINLNILNENLNEYAENLLDIFYEVSEENNKLSFKIIN